MADRKRFLSCVCTNPMQDGSLQIDGPDIATSLIIKVYELQGYFNSCRGGLKLNLFDPKKYCAGARLQGNTLQQVEQNDHKQKVWMEVSFAPSINVFVSHNFSDIFVPISRWECKLCLLICRMYSIGRVSDWRRGHGPQRFRSGNASSTDFSI